MAAAGEQHDHGQAKQSGYGIPVRHGVSLLDLRSLVQWSF